MKEEIALEENVVYTASSYAEEGWDSISINYEVFDYKGEIIQSNAFCWSKNGSENRVFDAAMVDKCLLNLSISMSEKKDSISWRVADVVIYSSGKYSFNYSYVEPPRISKMLRGEF